MFLKRNEKLEIKKLEIRNEEVSNANLDV